MGVSREFQKCKFRDIDINDHFFDSLKRDYPEFEKEWFPKCSAEGREAIVYYDEGGLAIFAALKNENEEIELENQILPCLPRIKISTFKISERFQGQRLGEGLIAYILWTWQLSNRKEIYVTLFDKQDILIDLFERFGFNFEGKNIRGEDVYIKSKKYIDFNNPYASFPFINYNVQNISYLPIEDQYHDTLFPYSELANTNQNRLNIASANGITKIYISQNRRLNFDNGDVLLIYRKHTGMNQKQYKSCITSFCVVDEIIDITRNGERYYSLNNFLKYVGNKSYFSDEELIESYSNYHNLIVIKMLYYGFFGEGNNISQKQLKDEGLWLDEYPTMQRLSIDQFIKILLMARLNPDYIIK